MSIAVLHMQLWTPNLIDTDQSPAIGRLIAIAANANLISYSSAPGDVQGDAGPPVIVSVTDAMLLNDYYDVTPEPVYKPGSIINVVYPGVIGTITAYVLKSFRITTDPENAQSLNPFTGVLDGGETFPVLYVQFCDACGGAAPQLRLGGQRLTVPLLPGQTAVSMFAAGPGALNYTLPTA